MNRRTLIIAVIAMIGAWLAPTSDAAAQSFDQLTANDQRIARALFEAQDPKTALSIDEIATLKKSGVTWGEIFSDFLVRDLVTDKKLGKLLKQYRSELEQAGREAGRASVR